MPNRLPPCPLCGPKYRHRPDACPKGDRSLQGIRNGLNDVSVADLLPPLRRIVQVLEALIQSGGK